MSEIQWSEPPMPQRPAGGRGKWATFFDELRRHPGRWALMGAFSAASTATAIHRGLYAGVKPNEFEATARKRPDRQYDVYVRYVGDAS